MKIIKKIMFVLVVCFLSIIGIGMNNVKVQAAEIPEATSSFYVNDNANIFSDSQNKALVSKAKDFSDSHDGTQVVITTINSLDDQDIKEYANKMYNKYQIGRDSNGILILFSKEDRKIRIEVGRGLEPIITDSKSGRLMDNYAIPDFKNGKYAEGLTSLQEAVLNEIESSTLASLDDKSSDVTTVIDEDSDYSDLIIGIFVIISGAILAVCGVIIFSLYSKNKKLSAQIADYPNKIAKKDGKISDLKTELTEIKKENKCLGKEVANKSKTISRAHKLHPNLDKEIEDMIEKEQIEKDKQIGKNFSEEITSIIHQTASRDKIAFYSDYITKYKSLTKRQRQYVTADVSRLSLLLKKSLELQQEFDKKETLNFVNKVRKEIASYNKNDWRNNLDIFGDIIYQYESFSSDKKFYCDKKIIQEAYDILKKSKKLKKEYDEEQRRIAREQERNEKHRMNDYNNDYGNYNNSFYSGSNNFEDYNSSDNDSNSGLGGFSDGGGSDREW